MRAIPLCPLHKWIRNAIVFSIKICCNRWTVKQRKQFRPLLWRKLEKLLHCGFSRPAVNKTIQHRHRHILAALFHTHAHTLARACTLTLSPFHTQALIAPFPLGERSATIIVAPASQSANITTHSPILSRSPRNNSLPMALLGRLWQEVTRRRPV